MKRFWCGILLVGCLAVGAGGCGREVVVPASVGLIEQAGTIELLSLDPTREAEPAADNLYGWRVLGRTTVADRATVAKLAGALRQGVLDAPDERAACFNPRHAIRVRSGGRVTDVVICFECVSAKVFEDGAGAGNFPVAATPEGVFDDVLRGAGVPLAAKGAGGR